MSWITARRRHPAAGYAVVAFVLVLIGGGYAVVTSGNASAASPVAANASQIAQGRSLFVEDCATCHGLFAEGVAGQAPSLIGVGAAAVDFQVSTGRMPAAEIGAENVRKPPHLNPAQTHAVEAQASPDAALLRRGIALAPRLFLFANHL